MESDSGEPCAPDVYSAGEARGLPSAACAPRNRRKDKPMPEPTARKTYGTISADRRRAMSGLEFIRGLVDGTLPLNTIAGTLGYDVAEVDSGRVVVTAVPTGAHLNPAGT